MGEIVSRAFRIRFSCVFFAQLLVVWCFGCTAADVGQQEFVFEMQPPRASLRDIAIGETGHLVATLGGGSNLSVWKEDSAAPLWSRSFSRGLPDIVRVDEEESTVVVIWNNSVKKRIKSVALFLDAQTGEETNSLEFLDGDNIFTIDKMGRIALIENQNRGIYKVVSLKNAERFIEFPIKKEIQSARFSVDDSSVAVQSDQGEILLITFGKSSVTRFGKYEKSVIVACSQSGIYTSMRPGVITLLPISAPQKPIKVLENIVLFDLIDRGAKYVVATKDSRFEIGETENWNVTKAIERPSKTAQLGIIFSGAIKSEAVAIGTLTANPNVELVHYLALWKPR